MLLGIDLPPELLAEVLRAAADGLEVVEVVGRDAFQLLADAAHGELGEAVLRAGVIEVPLEEAHELAALGLPRLGLLGRCLRNEVADPLHKIIVPNVLASSERRYVTKKGSRTATAGERAAFSADNAAGHPAG